MIALGASMLLSVAAVAALAFWDENREEAAALRDFGREQIRLAESVAVELETRLALARHDAFLVAGDRMAGRSEDWVEGRYAEVQVRPVSSPSSIRAAPGDFALQVPVGGGRTVDLRVAPAQLLAGMSRLARPGDLALLVASPGGALRAIDGGEAECPSLARAMDVGYTTARLPGPAASKLGLPARTAVAGMARIDAGPLGAWGVIAVASAERQRNRQERARLRLVLAVSLAAGLVIGFGGFALRQQRKELGLERDLAVAAIARERDDRLSRLSRAATMVTFAGGVAHEISTPLGVIAGRAEQLLARATGDERSGKYLRAILDQAEQIKQIIRGFLDLARGGNPDLREASPGRVAGEALSLVEHRFEQAAVDLRASVPAGLPEVRCEPRLLEQALVNLLLNACDASPRGGRVDLSVTAGPSAVEWVVTDRGDGIPESYLSHMADPFFTTKPRGKGTGLGLAIAAEIARIHRGSLRFERADPRGTRASLEIPLAQGEDHA